jgi:hypothetical protein
LAAAIVATGLIGTVVGGRLGASGVTVAPELGIAVNVSDTMAYNPATAVADAEKVFAYVKALNANSVSIVYPFYVTSQTSNDPHSGLGTPSVSSLAAVVAQARRDGLRVQLRPLLSDAQFNTPVTQKWRGSLTPTNPAAWFNAYWNWLEPYVAMAKLEGVTSFSMGAEFDSLMTFYPGLWEALLHKTQSIFGRDVVYSLGHLTYYTVPNARVGWDAYDRVSLTTLSQATAVSVLTPIIEGFYVRNGFPAPPNKVRLEEVGIPALMGAWQAPSIYTNPKSLPVTRWVQQDWFTANCNAFWKYHMQGIYFWTLNFDGFNALTNNTNDPYDWQNTTSAIAIKQCFARTS